MTWQLNDSPEWINLKSEKSIFTVGINQLFITGELLCNRRGTNEFDMNLMLRSDIIVFGGNDSDRGENKWATVHTKNTFEKEAESRHSREEKRSTNQERTLSDVSEPTAPL